MCRLVQQTNEPCLEQVYIKDYIENEVTIEYLYKTFERINIEAFNYRFDMDSDVVSHMKTGKTLTKYEPINFGFSFQLTPEIAEVWKKFQNIVESAWSKGDLKIIPTQNPYMYSGIALNFFENGPRHIAFPKDFYSSDPIKMELDKHTDYYSSEGRDAVAHEFGHLLGFRDCYLELYESSTNSFVSYALDPDDIMCARSGKFLPRHFKAIEEAYYGK